jgi:antitoxin ParD1/3/4
MAMKVSLSPELEQLVTERVETGLYDSPAEVIREALRLLKDRDELRQYRLEELRREIAVGLAEADRGELAPLDVEAIKAEGRRQLAKEQQDG